MAEFRMPALGADMDEGTLTEWLVKPGDQIRKGEPIAVIDTAKSAIEVESFHTGTVDRLIADIGETVPVGTVLATITEPGAPAPAAAEETAVVERAGAAAAAAGAAPPAPAEAEPHRVPAGRKRAKPAPAEGAAEGAPAMPAAAPTAPARRRPGPATPLVRREAQRLGVDLASVHGTGRDGAITRADVERAAAAPRRPRVTPLARRVAAELGVGLAAVTGTGSQGAIREEDVRKAARAAARPGAGRAERALAMRQAIARLMARSKREIPHYYVSNTVDLGVAMAWLRERNRELPVSARLVPAALLLKAAAVAARRVPRVNGYWADDRFEPAGHVHLGTATSLRGGGLVTPAIHDADRLSLAELMAALRDLVMRARAGRLRRAELTEATLTVTNLGDQGVESVHGVIYPPQVALVGFGKVEERPWAVGGLLGVRPLVVTTLAADHRATDGYTGARYLAALADLLQQPEEL